MIRTRECDRATRAGRLRKAVEFAEAADALTADHDGEQEIDSLLRTAMPEAAKALKRLLSVKTKAEYLSASISKKTSPRPVVQRPSSCSWLVV